MKKVIYLLSLFFPWSLRRWILCRFLKFNLHPTCRIGMSWVLPNHLAMGPYTFIGHLTFCKGLDRIQLEEYSRIGNGNWITGFPKMSKDLRQGSTNVPFSHESNRQPALILEKHSAITNRHLIDCTNKIHFGSFSILAGFGSQILTHSINLESCRQSSAPVSIGDYCFIGTNVVILGGSILPSYSIVGAKSLLNKSYTEEYWLYGGVPARPLKELDHNLSYFCRETGFVI